MFPPLHTPASHNEATKGPHNLGRKTPRRLRAQDGDGNVGGLDALELGLIKPAADNPEPLLVLEQTVLWARLATLWMRVSASSAF